MPASPVTPARTPLGAPGLERVLTRWLIPAYVIGVIPPWIIGAWIKTGYQPGLVNGDPQPTRDLIDIFCIGMSLFDATLVFTVGIGCLVVSIMKGPVRWADASYATQQVREPGERERF
ncbi:MULTISPECIES: hypothetical protein [unclassified Thiomonas]|jgi:hypothetical protein|uniref:hypothetical protein n=1 Tax=unclassified Thiomonas TaxID=2625466 RepID=UPI000BCA5B43|nr:MULTISPECIES: hypothetical protein [unclassified Thiomonas]OZB72230.1 MAG: hypothetical protein B7X30_01190 [Thiomonas sp. 13-64-67]